MTKVFSKCLCALLALMVCLFTAVILSANAYALTAAKKEVKDLVLYPSGCLKSMTVVFQADGRYGTAYGKIGIQKQSTSMSYTNPYLPGSSAQTPNSWPSTVDREGFIAFGSGSEFLWSNADECVVTVSFSDGAVNLNTTQDYYIYLWTRSATYGIYPDLLLRHLKTEGGKLVDENGNTIVENKHTHSWSAEWTTTEDYHWHECTASDCDVTTDSGKNGYGAHVYDKENTVATGALITAPTCTEKGLYYKSCVCGKIGTDTFETNPLGHSWKTTEWSMSESHHWHECAKGGLCTVTEDSQKDGYAEHTYTETVIEAALKTPANCANGAVYYKSCECGKLSEETFQTVALGNHVWSDKWTTDDTHHWHKCTVAGCTLNDNTQMDSYAEHIYDQENTAVNGAAIKAVSCTEDGEYYKSCVCGKIGTETFTVPALNHNWSTEWTKTATHHWHNCLNSGCPIEAEADKDAYAEHNFGEWSITVFATKKSDGVKERTCSDCGYKQTGAVKYIPDSNNEETGDVKNVTDPENNANNSDIVISKKDIIEKFNLTQDELNKIENGAEVNVSLEVGDITNYVSHEEKTKIDEAAAGEGFTVEQYLDINLWKIVDDGVNPPVKSPVHETSAPVTITFKMPDSLLIDANSELERKYYIVRVHNGDTDILDGMFDKATGMFSFKSDKFSGYGVGYSDKVGSPVFTPDSGTEFYSSVRVTISSSTPGAEIYYTTDGTTPTTFSQKYTGQIRISSDTTIKAIAVKTGKPDSDVVAAYYSKKTYSGGGGGGYVPSTPTDPTTPTDPADPTTPTDPADPTAPTDPANPTAPTDPADPTAPTDPTDPTAPTDPANPTAPTDPANPTTPTDTEKPEGDKPSTEKPATGGDGNNQGNPSGIGGEGGNDNPSTGYSMNFIPLIAAAAAMFVTRRRKK